MSVRMWNRGGGRARAPASLLVLVAADGKAAVAADACYEDPNAL